MSIRTKIAAIVIITISGFYILNQLKDRAVSPDSIQDKWMIYQRSLGLEIAGSPDSICEWIILGQNDQEVYMWAACRLDNLDVCQVRMSYATVFLDSTGGIEKVESNKDFQDIATYLPYEIRPITGSDVDGFMARTCMRHETPGYPYIVQLGTLLP